MTSFARLLAGGFLLLASLVYPSAIGAESACAAEGDRAALVVDTGGSVQTFCVSLPDGETSGLGLIALANEQHGLAYKLGFGGEAVCMLAGVGPTSDDCFEHYPDFWGYWRGDGNGGWIWSGTGAGSTSVSDGDVEGWSWGSGSNGDSHPRPPATTFGDLCAQETEEPPAAEPRPPGDEHPPSSASGGNEARGPGRSVPGPTAAVSGRRPVNDPGSRDAKKEVKKAGQETKRNTQRRSEGQTTAIGTGSPSPTDLDEQVTGALEATDPSRPPATGLAALAAAALLGGAGFFIARRRRSASSVR